jgi:hypothetical protein
VAVGPTATELESGVRDEQCSGTVRESAFGGDVEEAGDVRFREVGERGGEGQHPVEGQAHHAAAFPDAGGVELFANLPAHERGIVLEWIERQGADKGLGDGDGAVGAADDDAFEPLSIQGEAEEARARLAGEAIPAWQSE